MQDLADRPSPYVRLHPGSEGGEFDLALAISGSCWPVPPPASSCLKIRCKRCTNSDIYVVFQGLIKTLSLSTLGCHPPALLPIVQYLLPILFGRYRVHGSTVPSVHVSSRLHRASRASSSGPSTALVSPQSPRSPSSATSLRISKQPTVAANHSHPQRRPAPTISLRGSLWGTSRDRPEIEIPDQMDWVISTMTVNQAVQLGNHSRPNICARIARLAKIDSSPERRCNADNHHPNINTWGRVKLGGSSVSTLFGSES